MKKHFVTFYSPGTLFSETSEKPIDSWDVERACKMAEQIKERHGATPYGFRFSTRERKPNELDSKVTKTSGMYYLGGVVRTAEEVLAGTSHDENILRSNVRNNGYKKIIENSNSWKFTAPLEEGDVVLE